MSMHRDINVKWADELLQDLLNLRDEEFISDMESMYMNSEINLLDNVVPYLKYAVGMKNPPTSSTFNVSEL